ncbi:Bro-b [Artaxa digramma nucleopolyhedrovirus]|uniref:Bro-b n=1 Tax=Artaxa digramma nucleopolyhedrovirus TaxID=3070910 RepID=A0AAE6R6E4_9ABAC|nr:Bro-b [Euproctis digramma nucleopolyhedrovirus]QHB21718.1 Bro-b [Artaxa digramma nucleopolyhedrovirus]
MLPVKIGQFKFGEETFQLRYVVDENGTVKFVAKDIAASLKYVNCKQAIKNNVDEKYKSVFDQRAIINTPGSNNPVKQGDRLYLQAHTVLITKEGVIQLIMKSKLPYAVELQAWLLEEVIPQVLCTGKYQPTIKNDEIDKVIQGDVQIVTLNVLNRMSTSLQLRDNQIKIKDEQIGTLIMENKQLTSAIINLSNRMADIAQDVVAKPSDPQLLHSLAVCSLGNDEYAFLRAQKRSLNRSLKRLGSSDVVYKSDYVPNAMNVLNKVKEALPRDKFTARHNKITLLENLSRNQLIEAVQSSMTERQIARLNIIKQHKISKP